AGNDFGGILMRIGSTNNVGISIKNNIPRFAALTGWSNLDSSTSGPITSSNAGNSPFTNTTEILPIEVWSGTTSDVELTGAAIPPFFFDHYYMGTVPNLRNGRANFGDFTLSSESVS